jgi:hypothetical protein
MIAFDRSMIFSSSLTLNQAHMADAPTLDAVLTQCYNWLATTAATDDSPDAIGVYKLLRSIKRMESQLKKVGPKHGYFAAIPLEIIEHILSFLDFDFVTVSETCTLFWHTAETLAAHLFRAKFGTNKPVGASWSRCLLVVHRNWPCHNSMPCTVLFHGLSHPHFTFQDLHIDWHCASLNPQPSVLSIADSYKMLLKFELRDTINNLFVPYLIHKIKHDGWCVSVSANLFAAIMSAHDHVSFDAIMDTVASNRSSHTYDFNKNAIDLSGFLGHEWLPRLFHSVAQEPDMVECVIHTISKKCKSLQHVQFLDFALDTYGDKYPKHNPTTLGLFWSSKMIYSSHASEGQADLDTVDAYIDVWLKCRPDLFYMAWGPGSTWLDSFCNVFVRDTWYNGFKFLDRRPGLRLDHFPQDAANKWWDLCVYSDMDHVSSVVTLQIFDALHARGLPGAKKSGHLLRRLCALEQKSSAAQALLKHIFVGAPNQKGQ